MNQDRQTLILVHEEDMWSVYAGLNLDGAFNSYGEAAEYLNEEGFARVSLRKINKQIFFIKMFQGVEYDPFINSVEFLY